jgi:hypothetical protein
MPEKLDPEAKRLRKVSPGYLADQIARFCTPVHTGWRLTCTALRKVGVA